MKVMKGYKGFNKSMHCLDKQYAENTTFLEKGADSCCQAGVMHFCKDPIDVFRYYPPVDRFGNHNEYAEVEALGTIHEGNRKCAADTLKIGEKITLDNYIIEAIAQAKESVYPSDPDAAKNHVLSNSKPFVSSYFANNDHNAVILEREIDDRIADVGDNTVIASLGLGTTIAVAGSVNHIYSNGYDANIASSGRNSIIVTESADSSIASNGTQSRVVCNGDNSVAAAIGKWSWAKGKIGNWIVLAEYYEDEESHYSIKCVKAAQIDGVNLMPDTFYELKNGEFVAVEIPEEDGD